MNREPSIAVSAFRAASMAITLVSIVAVSTIAYSAFEDFDGVVRVFSHPPGSGTIQVRVVQQGAGATAYVNVSVANGGLYPLHLSFLCLPPPGQGVSCTSSDVNIVPRSSGTFGFVVTVANVSMLQPGSGLRVGGSMGMALEPFASMTISVDFSSALTQGRTLTG